MMWGMCVDGVVTGGCLVAAPPSLDHHNKRCFRVEPLLTVPVLTCLAIDWMVCVHG